ncbi:MAG: hypothetical protein K8R87_14685 [Verrucomicrobia bacterium]|nr:hypothetical protein [Verrucomicrobiota bacterium]
MKRRILSVILFLVMGIGAAKTAPVTGFGESSRGGTGGRTIFVTRRDDDPQHPREGSLRRALQERGPRIVKFAVDGVITLQERIIIREPYLTIDGGDAPRDGITIRGGSLMFCDTHDIIVRQVRIRLGEEPAARQRREYHSDRPPHSAGLDCVSVDDSRRIVFDHCSLSWSCDEIFGITRCRDVTIQWCILSEPLAGARLHPYGDRHAFPITASASTLSVHHCLFAHFVMRGPQFEANDMRPQDDWPVQLEAINNVVFDYEHSGSRYSSGVEKNNGTAAGKTFRFQFQNNLYLAGSTMKPTVEAITKHGVIPNVKVHASGNLVESKTIVRHVTIYAPRLFAPGKGPVLPEAGTISRQTVVETSLSPVTPPFWAPEENAPALWQQVSSRPFFRTSASGNMQDAVQNKDRVLREAGCSNHRDRVDNRIIEDITRQRF